MRSKSVVLPAPFGPTMPTISPSWSLIETSSTAVIPENRRVMPRVSSTTRRSPPFARTVSGVRLAIAANGAAAAASSPFAPTSALPRAFQEDRAQEVGAFEQLRREPVEADRALLHEERLVGGGERDVDRLLDEDHGHTLVAELLDDGEQLLDDERRQAERQLVDHEDVGFGEERHRQREHLLLAARQLRGGIARAGSAAPGRG